MVCTVSACCFYYAGELCLMTPALSILPGPRHGHGKILRCEQQRAAAPQGHRQVQRPLHRWMKAGADTEKELVCRWAVVKARRMVGRL